MPALAAIAAGSLVVTACGPASPPAVNSKPQSPVQPPVQQATAPAQVPAAAASPLPVPLTVATAPGKSVRLVIQGYASHVPATWTPTQLSSTMRVAQFALPAAAGAEAGELAAFFFPAGKGGSHEANIERWASQFAKADGKPATPKISTSKHGDTKLTLVELQGTYSRGVGMGPTGDAKPEQSLLVAMVETPVGRIVLQMYGPSKTVSAQRNSFLTLAKGFSPA